MAWQTVVVIVAVLATCCFYRWCHISLGISNNHRMIMEKQAEIAQSNVEYARLQGSNVAADNVTINN